MQKSVKPATKRTFISVIGESSATPENYEYAFQVGRLIAKAGAVLVCGALYGVMEAACKGAKSEGGVTIGVLPGSKRTDANKWVDFPIVTGVGYARNKYVVKSGHVCIAVGGSYGTLSEIAFALGYNIPVVGLNTWAFKQYGRVWDRAVYRARDPEYAVKKALRLVAERKKLEYRREYKS